MTVDALLPDVARTSFGEIQIAELTPMTGWAFSYNVNADMVKTTTSVAPDVSLTWVDQF